MFISSAQACSEHNSQTPITQQQIDDEAAFLASVDTAFDDGDNTLDSLITALGGNPTNVATGSSGVPTTGTLDTDIAGIPVVSDVNAPATSALPTLADPSFWAWAPSPAPGSSRQTRRRHAAPATGVPQNCPIIIPLITTIPVPTEAPSYPTTPVAPAAAPQAPALASGPAATPLPDCRTGNWCVDIMNGCVLDSQVSQQQLMACSQMGYAGNRGLFPAIQAQGGVLNGQYFGTTEPNPPQYEGSGMDGFGHDASAQAANASIFSSAFEYVIAGLVTVAAMAILSKSRKK